MAMTASLKAKLVVCGGDPAAWKILAIILAMVAYIAIAIVIGPDANCDLRNYHIYNGYNFLHGGGERNFFPAQFQSWHNPVFHAFFVFLLYHVPPKLVAGILAAIQSLNIPLAFLISRQALRPVMAQASRWDVTIMVLLATVIGITGAMTLSELGTSFADNVASVPLLAGLALLGHAYFYGRDEVEASDQRFFGVIACAGFAVGLAVGLKLTNVVYLPAFAICCFWLGKRLLQKIICLAAFGLAFLVGWGWLDGVWMWDVWQTTGNPIFPQMNNLFHSPLFDTADMTDHRFIPKSLAEALTFPFRTAIGDHPGAENFFIDARFAFAVLLLPMLVFRRPRAWMAAILTFFCVSYVLWMALFGIERFAIPLEIISGAVLVGFVAVSFSPQARLGAAMALTALLMLTTTPAQWGHFNNWDYVGGNGNWFKVDVPDRLKKPNEMFVLLSGDYSFSYIIPFFRDDARFVRMQGSFDPSPGTGFYEQRKQAIDEHDGPLWAVFVSGFTQSDANVLRAYKLWSSHEGCISVPTSYDFINFCPLRHVVN